ncbi:MAG: ImuA family protein, partial [Alphaproteobacteria bacterium]
MDEREVRLAELRASLARVEGVGPWPRVPLGHAAADACLEGGLRRGAVHEVFADAGHDAAATAFVALLCRRVGAQRPVFWIRPDFSAAECGELAAEGWLELGLDPARLLLLRVADIVGLLRAGHDALACGGLGAVVMECPGAPKSLTLAASQRLALDSARMGVTAFFLRLNASPQASAAETRWHVRALPSPGRGTGWGT